MKGWTPPPTFDGYRLGQLLGEGGMGFVYVAHDTLLDRPVAVKFIAGGGDAGRRERFVVEARAVARIQHPNVVATIDVVAELPRNPTGKVLKRELRAMEGAQDGPSSRSPHGS